MPNSALDIFWVLTYAGKTIGLSREDGPCDKDAKGMDGSVVAIEGSVNTTGFVLAHEAGHDPGAELQHEFSQSDVWDGSQRRDVDKQSGQQHAGSLLREVGLLTRRVSHVDEDRGFRHP